MARKPVVKFTAHFERNLEGIEPFRADVKAPQAFDRLLDELLDTVIPNLERFPEMGRPFLARLSHSVETTNALAALRAIGADSGRRSATRVHTQGLLDALRQTNAVVLSVIQVTNDKR